MCYTQAQHCKTACSSLCLSSGRWALELRPRPVAVIASTLTDHTYRLGHRKFRQYTASALSAKTLISQKRVYARKLALRASTFLSERVRAPEQTKEHSRESTARPRKMHAQTSAECSRVFHQPGCIRRQCSSPCGLQVSLATLPVTTPDLDRLHRHVAQVGFRQRRSSPLCSDPDPSTEALSICTQTVQ